MNRSLGILIFLFLYFNSIAQTTENKAWFFLSHTQELSKEWNVLADVQLRSSDKLKRIETVLLRSALAYNFNDEHSVAVGYAYKGDWEEAPLQLNYQIEHRIYQQYLYSHNLKRTELTVRFRLEQRLVKEEEAFDFSQRLRSFLSFQIPVSANKDFSKGLYTALQNEVFMNVQHKENVNNHFLEQNRAYVSIGYRWNKKIDTEIGYYNWRQKEEDQSTTSNVVQLMFTTSF
jgi:hypothetical protein